jgi:protein-S-isoprenylcysteine O-methyltransferase Ste14
MMVRHVLLRGVSFRRLGGWIVGGGAQLAFAFTVIGLYQFLASHRAPTGNSWLIVDIAIALLFAAPHSVLRLPRVQKKIAQEIGREFYGAFYCWVTCLSLAIVFIGWRSSSTTVWSTGGIGGGMLSFAFHASWLALAYSLHLTGIGYQTGLTEWNSWRRREPLPRRQFSPRGAYAWMRHPVYLSFLGLIWFHPEMTADKLVLALVWTAYIAVGSYLKDERLAYYTGREYRLYQERVPGYPGMYWGPLGIRPSDLETTEAPSRTISVSNARGATTN